MKLLAGTLLNKGLCMIGECVDTKKLQDKLVRLHENPTLVHESPKEVLQEEPLVIDGVVEDERPWTPTSTSEDESQ